MQCLLLNTQSTIICASLECKRKNSGWMRHHRKPMSGLERRRLQCWKGDSCVTNWAVKLKTETDNIWSCWKIWFHSLISLNHLWRWRPKRQTREHTVCRGNAAAGSEHKSKPMSRQLETQQLLLHSQSNNQFEEHFTAGQRIEITTKVVLSSPFVRKFPPVKEWNVFH